MGAAVSNHAGTVKLLLEAGADKDAQNARGATALLFAAEGGCGDSLQPDNIAATNSKPVTNK